MQAICVLVEEGFPLRRAPGEALTAKRWLERENLIRPFQAVYSGGLMRRAQFIEQARLS